MSSSATVRARTNGKSADTAVASTSKGIEPAQDGTSRRRSIFDVLRVIGGLALLSTVLSYFITGTYFWSQDRPIWTNPSWLRWRILGDIYLTPAELAQYDGTNPGKPIYLALNGTIYDVSASPHFYGPGGGYHVFAGADATRAFVTGCFKEDRTDDMRGAEDIYMPLDLDDPPASVPGISDAEKKEARRTWKNRKAQAKKLALEKVRSGIEKWKESFEGTKDKYGSGKTKYFKVGTVRLLPEDLKIRQDGPKPTLCPRALNLRPKTAAELGIL